MRGPALALSLASLASATAAQGAASRPASAPAPALVLEEVDPAAAGIDFVHHMGAAGEKFVVETMGSGLAIFDADGDGDPDLYLLQGRPMPGCPPFDGRSRLYTNEGGWRFADATDRSGLADAGYAMGAAVADAENDGDLDVYVSAYGRGHLFLNKGGGSFEDATERSGVLAEGFLASAAFGDLDGDGLVDLYIANYLEWSEVRKNPFCGKHTAGGRAYCSPHAFSGAKDFLYRNRGEGRFEDVSAKTGVARAGRFDGKGLGVVMSDLDDDGDLDVFVANDSCANFLYRNDGAWKLEEVAAIAGVAFAEDGRERAGMGTDAADCDGDGLPDLLVCNLAAEPNSFFRNRGNLAFDDESGVSGLGPPSVPFVGFGCGLVDLDGDGDRDALVVNGHILDNAELFGDASPYRERPLLFENTGGARFRLLARTQAFLQRERVLRGLAFGDLDGDGDPDAVATPSEGPPVLLRNVSPPRGRWIVLCLEGNPSNRAAIGARIRATTGGQKRTAEVRTGSSYLSASSSDVSIGIDGDSVDRIEIRWPSGKVAEHRGLTTGRRWRIRESGEAVPLGPLAPH